MNQKISIRKFDNGDADNVSRLIIDNLTTRAVLDYGKAAVTQLVQFYSPQQMKDCARNEELYVALDASEIVGTAGLDQSRIRNVFVRTDHHRRGIGSQLVRHLEDIAARQGKVNVFLFANLSTVDFYQEQGYSIVEEKTEAIGTVTLAMMLMIKRLPHNR
jgi:N-acetylglutamate synthase-like GNAT family acetyltransferase